MDRGADQTPPSSSTSTAPWIRLGPRASEQGSSCLLASLRTSQGSISRGFGRSGFWKPCQARSGPRIDQRDGNKCDSHVYFRDSPELCSLPSLLRGEVP